MTLRSHTDFPAFRDAARTFARQLDTALPRSIPRGPSRRAYLRDAFKIARDCNTCADAASAINDEIDAMDDQARAYWAQSSAY